MWYARWHDQHGKEHKEKAGSKAAAKAIYLRRKAAALEGRQSAPARSDPTVADLVAAYEPEILAKNERSASEYSRYGRTWTEAIGSQLVSRLTAGELERWKAAKLKTHKPATVNLLLRYLKMLINLAIRDRLVESNPLARGRVREAPEHNQRDRILSPEEEAQLGASLPRSAWLQVVVAIQTGLRQSEQLGLRVEHVDLAARRLELPRAKGERKGGKQFVRLNSLAAEALAEVVGDRKLGWVWPAKTGGSHQDGTALTKKLQRHCARLGFAPGVTWHMFRHTFISRLCMLGVPLPTVQKLARHKSITMTLRYAHLCPSHEDSALESLAKFC